MSPSIAKGRREVVPASGREVALQGANEGEIPCPSMEILSQIVLGHKLGPEYRSHWRTCPECQRRTRWYFVRYTREQILEKRK